MKAIFAFSNPCIPIPKPGFFHVVERHEVRRTVQMAAVIGVDTVPSVETQRYKVSARTSMFEEVIIKSRVIFLYQMIAWMKARGQLNGVHVVNWPELTLSEFPILFFILSNQGTTRPHRHKSVYASPRIKLLLPFRREMANITQWISLHMAEWVQVLARLTNCLSWAHRSNNTGHTELGRTHICSNVLDSPKWWAVFPGSSHTTPAGFGLDVDWCGQG